MGHGADRPRRHGAPGAAGDPAPRQGRLRHPDPRRSVGAQRPRGLAATVYVALKRLEQKGLVTSRLGDSTPERGGRAKRFFKLKPSGLKALRESREMFLGLWRDYESVLDRA